MRSIHFGSGLALGLLLAGGPPAWAARARGSVFVSVVPGPATLATGQRQVFSAQVSGSANKKVAWSVLEAGGGSITEAGAYTAPALAGTYHVRATSAADETRFATAAVTVAPRSKPVISSFTASPANIPPGASSLLKWSVSGAGSLSISPGPGRVSGGSLTVSPASTTTYTLTATNAAGSVASRTTVTVTAPIRVAITPASLSLAPGGTGVFSATVSGTAPGQSAGVTWSIQEGGGGTITSGGAYTAPAAPGTYHVLAASQADPTQVASATVLVSAGGLLPPDRATVWNPGLNALGGIPERGTVFATLDAAACGANGAADATACIQAALDACPAGQVVQLGPGRFTINGGNYLQVRRGITLRGSGPGVTILQKTDGARPYTEATGPNPSPIILVGPARWKPDNSDNAGVALAGASTNLMGDGTKGSYSVAVASSSGLSAGQFVLVDEVSGAAWQTDPAGRGRIWASPDGRVVWQLHDPPQGTDDPLSLPAAWSNQDAFSWFSRTDRPTNEIKQIASISGNTITFTTPLHIDYRASHGAQVSRFGYDFTTGAGIEDLTVIGGDNGNVRFQWCAGCWARRVENTTWHDEGFAIDASFRVELRQVYVHDAAWAQPGGAGYAISLAQGSSEVLVEDSISIKANKVMVARSSGAGSVFGYNYVDEGYINTNGSWIEVGLNASHMVGPHHVLFEGNHGFNWDSDKTHGNAVYHTVFRNYLTGFRRPFAYQDQGDGATHAVDDAAQASANGPARCAGATYYSYWHSFLGNVLGVPGQMGGFVYEGGDIFSRSVWKLGWDDWAPYPSDPKVAATTLRHGNFDYLTQAVHWDPTLPQSLPPSLYLSQKPAFFNAGKGYAWPWVEPAGAQPVLTLPAKARYDAGTPFVQP